MAIDFNGGLEEMLAEDEREAREVDGMVAAARDALGGRPFVLCGRWSDVAQRLLAACLDRGLGVACFCDADADDGGGGPSPRRTAAGRRRG